MALSLLLVLHMSKICSGDMKNGESNGKPDGKLHGNGDYGTRKCNYAHVGVMYSGQWDNRLQKMEHEMDNNGSWSLLLHSL